MLNCFFFVLLLRSPHWGLLPFRAPCGLDTCGIGVRRGTPRHTHCLLRKGSVILQPTIGSDTGGIMNQQKGEAAQRGGGRSGSLASNRPWLVEWPYMAVHLRPARVHFRTRFGCNGHMCFLNSWFRRPFFFQSCRLRENISPLQWFAVDREFCPRCVLGVMCLRKSCCQFYPTFDQVHSVTRALYHAHELKWQMYSATPPCLPLSRKFVQRNVLPAKVCPSLLFA